MRRELTRPTIRWVRPLWERLESVPGGRRVFQLFLARLVPYTGTIHPEPVELRHGYAEIRMRDRRAVRNHLDCVHAIALANLAELTGSFALLFSMPEGVRWIVTGLKMTYVKKARGAITGRSYAPLIELARGERRELTSQVELTNDDGEAVVRAEVTILAERK